MDFQKYNIKEKKEKDKRKKKKKKKEKRKKKKPQELLKKYQQQPHKDYIWCLPEKDSLFFEK